MRKLLTILIISTILGGGICQAKPAKKGSKSEVAKVKVDTTLPSWSEGCLDIHFINSARGECCFYILPDGTTLLVDAGEVADSECQVIETIAVNMGIADADYQSLLSLYRKHTDTNWAYTALEIEPSATDDEVKKAYRRMAMKYHPDKVANAGEAVRQQATEKFRAINEAYEHIKSLRGM